MSISILFDIFISIKISAKELSQGNNDGQEKTKIISIR